MAAINSTHHHQISKRSLDGSFFLLRSCAGWCKTNTYLKPECDLPRKLRLMFNALFFFHNNLGCTVIQYERLLAICKRRRDISF